MHSVVFAFKALWETTVLRRGERRVKVNGYEANVVCFVKEKAWKSGWLVRLTNRLFVFCCSSRFRSGGRRVETLENHVWASVCMLPCGVQSV